MKYKLINAGALLLRIAKTDTTDCVYVSRKHPHILYNIVDKVYELNVLGFIAVFLGFKDSYDDGQVYSFLSDNLDKDTYSVVLDLYTMQDIINDYDTFIKILVNKLRALL